MANRITTIIDFVTDGATRSVKTFRNAVAEAEGVTGKFKAGASSAMQTVQANAGTLALAGGAALAGFATKSVKAFQDTALAAGKLSDATGLTVEDASRLQEVAGDLGLSTDALAGSLVRMQKAVASNSDAVKALGIETKRTDDGQVDVNATFLDAVRKLGEVEDANEKALLASQLFGKGFADSAELILGDADEIEKRLAGVSDAQVISDDQVARARKFRDQMDGLADSLKQVEITVGDQVVPVVGALADALVLAEEKAKDLNDVLAELPGGFSLGGINRGELGAFGLFVRAVSDARDALSGDGGGDLGAFNAVIQNLIPEVNEAGHVMGDFDDELGSVAVTAEMTNRAIDRLAFPLQETNELAREGGDAWNVFEDGLRKAEGTLNALDSALKDIRDSLDMEGQLDDITDQFEAVRVAAEEIGEGGEPAVRRYKEEVRRLRLQLLDLLEDLDSLSAKDKITLAAEIERGSIDDLFRSLGELSKGVTVPVVFGTPQQAFSGVDVVVGSGFAPTPIFNNLNPAPVNNSQTTIIYPVGTTPTTTFLDESLYRTRNGTNPR